MGSQFTFFENQTTNATSEAYDITDGGIRALKATGTFDSATITIEMTFAGDSNWAPIQSYQFTEADIKKVTSLKTGLQMRAVLSTAGASTNVTLIIM
jgi:hypothetical protein